MNMETSRPRRHSLGTEQRGVMSRQHVVDDALTGFGASSEPRRTAAGSTIRPTEDRKVRATTFKCDGNGGGTAGVIHVLRKRSAASLFQAGSLGSALPPLASFFGARLLYTHACRGVDTNTKSPATFTAGALLLRYLPQETPGGSRRRPNWCFKVDPGSNPQHL